MEKTYLTNILLIIESGLIKAQSLIFLEATTSIVIASCVFSYAKLWTC